MRFTQRKRAKDAATALSRLNDILRDKEVDDLFVDVKVFIYDQQSYYLNVMYPNEQQQMVGGMLSLGEEVITPISADDCVEFYQGPGLTRFRAI